MASLTFTSHARGEVYQHGTSAYAWTQVVTTKHVWDGIEISDLDWPDEDRAVFIPATYLFAKVAAGQVPADYEVDLDRGMLLQRTAPNPYRAAHLPAKYVHPLRQSGGKDVPSFLPPLDDMVLCFVEGVDDPHWTAGPGGRGPKGGDGCKLAFQFKGGATISTDNDATLPGCDELPPERTSLFAFLLSPAVVPSRHYTYRMDRATATLFGNAKLRESFAKPLEIGKVRHEENKAGVRSVELEDRSWTEAFPKSQFEWGGMLAFGLDPDTFRLAPFERGDTGLVRMPGPDEGRLYLHLALDAWRAVVTLPCRSVMTQRYGGATWASYQIAMAFRIEHAQTSNLVLAVAGASPETQARIARVPGLSSVIAQAINSAKGRLTRMPHRRSVFQGGFVPKLSILPLFGDVSGGEVKCRSVAVNRYDLTIEDVTRQLGVSVLVASAAVQRVAPTPLTVRRMIDL